MQVVRTQWVIRRIKYIRAFHFEAFNLIVTTSFHFTSFRPFWNYMTILRLYEKFLPQIQWTFTFHHDFCYHQDSDSSKSTICFDYHPYLKLFSPAFVFDALVTSNFTMAKYKICAWQEVFAKIHYIVSSPVMLPLVSMSYAFSLSIPVRNKDAQKPAACVEPRKQCLKHLTAFLTSLHIHTLRKPANTSQGLEAWKQECKL